MALQAAKASDLILIPCRPSYFDLEAMTSALSLLQTAGKRGLVVLNAVAARGPEADAAAAVIEALGLALCPVRLGRRIAYARAVESGQTVQEIEPRGKAAAEIGQLYEEVKRNG